MVFRASLREAWALGGVVSRERERAKGSGEDGEVMEEDSETDEVVRPRPRPEQRAQGAGDAEGPRGMCTLSRSLYCRRAPL